MVRTDTRGQAAVLLLAAARHERRALPELAREVAEDPAGCRSTLNALVAVTVHASVGASVATPQVESPADVAVLLRAARRLADCAARGAAAEADDVRRLVDATSRRVAEATSVAHRQQVVVDLVHAVAGVLERVADPDRWLQTVAVDHARTSDRLDALARLAGGDMAAADQLAGSVGVDLDASRMLTAAGAGHGSRTSPESTLVVALATERLAAALLAAGIDVVAYVEHVLHDVGGVASALFFNVSAGGAGAVNEVLQALADADEHELDEAGAVLDRLRSMLVELAETSTDADADALVGVARADTLARVEGACSDGHVDVAALLAVSGDGGDGCPHPPETLLVAVDSEGDVEIACATCQARWWERPSPATRLLVAHHQRLARLRGELRDLQDRAAASPAPPRSTGGRAPCGGCGAEVVYDDPRTGTAALTDTGLAVSCVVCLPGMVDRFSDVARAWVARFGGQDHVRAPVAAALVAVRVAPARLVVDPLVASICGLGEGGPVPLRRAVEAVVAATSGVTAGSGQTWATDACAALHVEVGACADVAGAVELGVVWALAVLDDSAVRLPAWGGGSGAELGWVAEASDAGLLRLPRRPDGPVAAELAWDVLVAVIDQVM